MMNDGWAALCIAILRGVGCERAFELLEHPEGRRRKWMDEDIEEIITLREKGYKWLEIDGMFGVPDWAAYRALCNRRRMKRNEEHHEKHIRRSE